MAEKHTREETRRYLNQWGCIPGSEFVADGSASAQMKLKNGTTILGDDGYGGTNRSFPHAIVIRGK